MTCYHPLSAWRVEGQSALMFSYPNTRKFYIREALEVPCGQCIGCRLERSRQWAIRCIHEAQLHEKNCFITLTYAPEHLPNPPTLVLSHWQKFMKRLRKRYGSKIRFFHCGEYGEKFRRPHYHACLFNHDFPDKKLWKVVNGQNYYISEQLNELWPFGFSTIGEVTFESAAYVARYILKKQTGDGAHDYYTHVDPATGEWSEIRPEYVTMSRRPGIAAGWFEKYRADVYPHDYVVVRGRKMRPPKFYDRRLQALSLPDYEEVQMLRHIEAQKYVDNCTEERLAVREAVQEARLKQLPRSLE
ncbi:replication initiator protein [Apis mellifera associated microvirus 3]|nr:replication initiator protein [Apis mellifera associated microvirus 3]AZL82768.1 replication initiator protein [Apis mellifera associated microvirus 3]